MATYVILSHWTDQGSKNVKDTVQRAHHFFANCERHGVKVLSFHWTQGRYDTVAVLDAPDEQAVMASVLALSSLGNVHTETLRAFNETEMAAILQNV